MTTSAETVRVAVPRPLHALFDYSIPDGLATPVIGARVAVPFGRQRLTAICVARNPPDAHSTLKPIHAVLDDGNAFGDELYELASWLAEYYHHPLGEVFGTILPVAARREVELVIHHPETWQRTDKCADLTRAPKQQALVDHFESEGGVLEATQLREAGFKRAIIRAIAGKGLIAPTTFAPPREQLASEVPVLNSEQTLVLAALIEHLDGFAPSLLDGITGSGKTEIYLRLIERLRAEGRQVLVLVPEIALTPQTVARFQQRFGVAEVLHSNLTAGQRLQTWLKCKRGDVGILIGTRSAILTPFANLGLIVVDEEHDSSFKQTDGLRYSARDVAVKRAQNLGIPMLLGTATPSLESLLNAKSGRYRHLRLTRRAGGAELPSFHLLDIRGHKLADGLSVPLQQIINRHLGADGQVLVFLNRRGYAPSYLCPYCGWQATCSQCDTPMTLHKTPPALICHHCARRETPSSSCPACGRQSPIAIGIGTQRAAEGLLALFPDTPLYRIDRDSTRSRRRMEEQFQAIRQGQPAILVGTQMLAKGHHFPNVTLVAVLNADGGFCSADFRAPERTAQLIIQVAGRAGRAQRPGQVWIQTYQPENPLLVSLIEEGYESFATAELESRHRSGLPPYRPMAMVRAESRDTALPIAFLTDLRTALAGEFEILGPAPAPVQRIADRNRYQLLLLADNRRALHLGLHRLRDKIAKDHPVSANLRWSLDVDPYDTF
ncbi:MAG: primosomal protein N' [Gammaproteobacteria bacterium]|nr:primosomal protein N' [Gammaproteobacteria bacterium]